MHVLRGLVDGQQGTRAGVGVGVLLAIHQPSPAIWRTFDTVRQALGGCRVQAVGRAALLSTKLLTLLLPHCTGDGAGAWRALRLLRTAEAGVVLDAPAPAATAARA